MSPSRWRLLYRQGLAARALVAVAGVLSVGFALVLIAFLPVALVFAALAWREGALLEWEHLLGAVVALVVVGVMVAHVREKVLDWVRPARTFEGRVDDLLVEMVTSPGAQGILEEHVVKAGGQSWTIPERCWKELARHDVIRLRFRAGSRCVLALEVETRQ